FEVPNVDKATQELKAKGVVFETEPTDRSVWGIRTAHFRDPDGNLIEINQALT
ncbi:MAG: VOC family protein, partial [Desulfobacterales bacterium]